MQDPIENDLMEKSVFGVQKEIYIKYISVTGFFIVVAFFFFPRQELIVRGFFPTIQENHFLAININGFSNKLHT